MNLFLLLIGAALILIAFLDALWTTLWVDGSAGPVSSRMTTWAWRAVLAVVGRRRHRLLSLFGPFVLSMIVVLWVTLLWLGWTLVYAADALSLTHASDGTPADWAGRLYFVGYMMFTAGNGDYTPDGDAWQIAAALTNATGMLLATLAITYLLSVISAVVQKRAFASQVAGLGKSAAEIVESGWNGQDLRGLELPISTLSSELSQVTERYLAYPILQYYHAAKAEKSPVIAVALLDEALSIIRYAVPEQHRPSPAVLRSARSSVRSFLDTMPSAFIAPAPEAPPRPDLSAVRGAGIPTVAEEQFLHALHDLSERRRLLLGLVRNDGWEWTDR
jgi:Ion channel